MIDVGRLSDRAQSMIVRGLKAQLDLLRSAQKAAEKATAGATEVVDDINYIVGDSDSPGLLDRILGTNRDLFEGALKDDKQLAFEAIEQMPEDVVLALQLLGASLQLAEAADIPSSEMASFLAGVVDAMPAAVAGIKSHEPLYYAERRQGYDAQVLAGDRTLVHGTTMIAATAIAQGLGWTGRHKAEKAAPSAKPENAGGEA